MKRRVIAPILLSLGVAGTAHGHVKAPILPVIDTEFRPVEIAENSVNLVPKAPIIRDFDIKREYIAPNRPKIAQIEPKIEKKEPKIDSNGGFYSSRKEAKLAALAYARNRLSHKQFSCLKTLWARESGWHYWKLNRYSGAYGIPQALPGSKMKSFGSDWKTNPITQVKWGINYVNKRYGSSCRALAFHNNNGWY